MNVLLLGADGFLGCYLQIALETAGHTVPEARIGQCTERTERTRSPWTIADTVYARDILTVTALN